MIAKIELTKLGRNCAIAITEIGTSITQTFIEDSTNIEMCYNQGNNTVTVTIFGTTSATTPNITTGTYLTMDTGTGAVTITSYATFKTNYALLFLNGGSAPAEIPTLDQVLTSGYIANTTPFIQLNDAVGSVSMGNLNFNAVNSNYGNPNNSYLFAEYLQFQRFTGTTINSNTYLTSNPTNTGNAVITNYLPETSGTLLNGQLVGTKGLFIDYTNNFYALGNSAGANLQIDDNTSANFIIASYYNNVPKGFYLNFDSEVYQLGDGLAQVTCNNGFAKISLTADILEIKGAVTDGTAPPDNPLYLIVTVNDFNYKILMNRI